MDYLTDQEFLNKLNQHKHRETYVKIIALTFSEEPVELIEGMATQVSISIDGFIGVKQGRRFILQGPLVALRDELIIDDQIHIRSVKAPHIGYSRQGRCISDARPFWYRVPVLAPVCLIKSCCILRQRPGGCQIVIIPINALEWAIFRFIHKIHL